MASKKLWQRQATAAATAWETLHRKFHSGGGGDGGKEKRNRESGGGGIERRRRGRRQREEGEDGRNCGRRGLCNSGQCELQQWRRRGQAEVQVR